MVPRRNLQMWHVPKRSGTRQIIAALRILTRPEFDGQLWTTGRKEKFSTEYGKLKLPGLRGRTLSPSGRRTLLALLKYLGLLNVETEVGRRQQLLVVTDAGHQFLRAPTHIMRLQMIKLQLTNPSILEDCTGIHLFPFVTTLRLLKELGYLCYDEMGYILFFMANDGELQSVRERILKLRSLSSKERAKEIVAFGKTPEGQLALIKAPTVGYYTSLCLGTGLCEKQTAREDQSPSHKKILIRENMKEIVDEILDSFSRIKPYYFNANLPLWVDYYTVTSRLRPPKDIIVRIEIENGYENFIRIQKDKKVLIERFVDENKFSLEAPFFENEDYKLEVYNVETASLIEEKRFKATGSEISFKLKAPAKKPAKEITKDQIVKYIEELLISKEVDSILQQRIELLRGLKKDFTPSMTQLRGGRLEQLISELLKILKRDGIIDDFIWNGRLDVYGIAYPAPGGDPDFLIYIDHFLIILEVTTIGPIRMQWDKEGAAVPDHVDHTQEVNPAMNVIGIFSAPEIHDRLGRNLTQISKAESLPILCWSMNKTLRILLSSSYKNLVEIVSREAENLISK